MIPIQQKVPATAAPPIPERYRCTKECPAPMRAVGSISKPQDRNMWLHEPHRLIEMDQRQVDEWTCLIRETRLE